MTTDLPLNEEKIKHFYNKVICLYPSEFKELYWGKIDDFIYLIKNFNLEEDSVTIECKNSENIKLSQTMFDFLFKGNDLCTFDNSSGQRYEYKDYVFIEFIESWVLTVNKKIEERGILPITKDENGNIESCFFIKSENPEENYYDYPQEMIPFFVSQLKIRLKISEDKLPSYFIDHFESMKYALKINKVQENLLIKSLYILGTNLGIVEKSIMKNGKSSVKIDQEIKSALYDGEGNINLTDDYDENLSSLKFYISAIKNSNPYYRFLDAYHIFESLFYESFYNYVKNLNHNQKKKIYDKIKEHTDELHMLKLVLINCLDNQGFTKKIKDKLVSKEIQKLAKIIDKDYDINNWPVDNLEVFASKLSDLIYAFRNAIVHSKDSYQHIEKIEELPDLTQKFIELTNIVLEIAKCLLEKKINRW